MPDTSNPAAAPAAPTPYPGLEQLRAEHANLLRRRRLFEGDGEGAAGFLPEVEQFVRRGAATGTLLDADADRNAAQDLLTYWANFRYRASGEPSEADLAEFDPGHAPDLSDVPCPYLGLDELVEGTGCAYAGWQRLIGEMTERLAAQRLTAVVGPRGSGRTSLVLGGLVPALKRGALPGSAGWRYLPPLSLGPDPLTDLARALRPGGEDNAEWVRQQAEGFRNDPGLLKRLLDERGREPALLVVDHFHHLFSQAKDADARQAFLDNVLHLVRAPEGRHAVVLVMRTDYLSYLAPLDALRPLFQASQVYMAFTTRELRQAIEGPARHVGLRFDEGVVDRLLLEVQGDPAALTLLQFTLLQLWDHREGHRITRQVYDRLGGGRLALERAAEAVWRQLTPAEQAAARAVCLRLVEPAAGGGFVSEAVSRAALDGLAAPGVVAAVLDRLRAAHLLRCRPGRAPGGETVALVHESLATLWPRFAGWLEEARDLQRHRQRRRDAAEQWNANGRKREALWRGWVLAEAREQAAASPPNPLEKEFLDASQRAEDRRRYFRWSLLALAAAACAIVVGFIIHFTGAVEREKERIRHDAAEQRQKAQRRALEEQMSMRSLADGMRQLEAGDVAGSFHHFVDALHRLEKDDSAPTRADQDTLASHRVRLGVALQRLPRLAHLVYQKDLVTGALSPDGRYALTCGKDRVVRLWSLEDGQPVGDPWPVTAVVNLAYFSPDGRSAVTATGGDKEDGKVQLWQVPGGASRELPPHKGQVILAAFSDRGPAGEPGRDGAKPQRLVTVSQRRAESEGEARVWDVDSGDLVAEFPTSPGVVTAAALSPDGNLLALASRDPRRKDGVVRVLDVNTRKEVGRPLDHDEPVNYVAFAPDRGTLAGAGRANGSGGTRFAWLGDPRAVLVTAGGEEGSRKGTARLCWLPRQTDDAQNQVWQAAPLSHGDAVTHASFSPDGRFLVTSSQDTTARVWDLTQWWLPPVKELPHQGWVYSARFSPDGRYIVTACRDRCARVWDAARGELALPPLNHCGTVGDALFSADGRRVVTASDDTLYAWELGGEEITTAVLRPAGNLLQTALSADGRFAVTAAQLPGSNGGEARVWDVRTREAQGLAWRHQRPISFVALSPRGRYAVSASDDGAVRVWDVAGQRPVGGELRPHGSRRVNHAAFSPDERLLVTVTGNPGEECGEAQVWEVGADKVEKKKVYAGHHAAATFAAFSPQGDRVVTTTGEKDGPLGEVKVWEVAGDGDVSLDGHEEPVFMAAFSPKGDRLVTASADDTARIWDATSGALLQVLGRHKDGPKQGHTADVVWAAFGPDDQPDGQLVVTAGMDAAVFVWDAATGRVRSRLDHKNYVTRASFSPDGRYVVTACKDALARVWEARSGTFVTLLKHPAEVSDAFFAHDGRVTTLCIKDIHHPDYAAAGSPRGAPRAPRAPSATRPRAEVRSWNLAPLEHVSAEDLLKVAQVLTGQRMIGDLNGLDRLDPGELYGLWSDGGLRKQYDELLPSRGALRRARDGEAASCEADGQLQAALWHLDRWLEEEPGRGRDIHFRKARIFVQLGQGEAALESFDTAIRQGNRSWQLYQERARFHLGQKKWKEAADDFQQALKQEQRGAELWAGLAEAHVELARLAGADPALLGTAIAEYGQAIELAPADGNLWRKRGAARAQRKVPDWPAVVRDYETAAGLLPDDLEFKKDQAVAYGKAAGQAADQRAAMLLHQQARDAHAQLARKYAEGVNWGAAQGQYFAALTADDKVAENGGPRQPPSWRAEMWAGQGRADARRGFWDKAATEYDKALKLSPADWQLWQELAAAYANGRHYPEAAAAYGQAIELKPDNAPLLRLFEGRARAHALQGHGKDAAADYSSALALKPGDLNLLQSRAQAWVAAGEWDRALADYDEVLRLLPRNSWPHAQKADIYAELGKWDDALRELGALPSGAGSVTYRFRAALLHLKKDDREGYRAVCKELLDRPRSGTDGNMVLWAAVVGGKAVDDPESVLDLARSVIQLAPRNPEYLNTLGAAYYRAGLYKEAVQQLEESIKLLDASPEYARQSGCYPENWLFLALAYQGLGGHATQEARESLGKAARWMDDRKKTPPKNPTAERWTVWNRIELELLRKEAEEMVAPGAGP